jgi:hypothetical protein
MTASGADCCTRPTIFRRIGSRSLVIVNDAISKMNEEEEVLTRRNELISSTVPWCITSSTIMLYIVKYRITVSSGALFNPVCMRRMISPL